MSEAYNKIISKLQCLDEYIDYLKELQKVNKKSFLNDYHFFGLAEHYLHLSIEALLDVSKLIVIGFGLPRPEEQRDIMRVLHEKKVISEKLYSRLSGITGFRNILVHEYEKIDKEIIYVSLQKNIDQFVQFKKDIMRFLRRKR